MFMLNAIVRYACMYGIHVSKTEEIHKYKLNLLVLLIIFKDKGALNDITVKHYLFSNGESV